jgi:tetratricopeptide (TPR) repeat protein
MQIKKFHLLVVFLVFLCLCTVAAVVPGLRERILTRLDGAQQQVRAVLFPPQRQIFVPQNAVDEMVAATLTAAAPTVTPTVITATPTVTKTLEPDKPTATPTLKPSPTVTPTPLPASMALKGVRYMDQHAAWNYCAPANMGMALSFWGWGGTREDVGKVVKPYAEDKNVMPYELANYVEENTKLKVILRPGATQALIKSLIAGGFPVLVERGAYIEETTTKLTTWMGHYQVITGYTDEKKEYITQDSYFRPDYLVSYKDMETGMRAFNYAFLVVYPPEKEQQVYSILGSYVNEAEAYQIAFRTAANETVSQTGLDQFFAWYNRGTNLVYMQDYAGAAQSFDQALAKLYPALPLESNRLPFRMTWYQTGPYFAYYYMGRYRDVVNLVSETLTTGEKRTGKPLYLEESFYWRARALSALGDNAAAREDIKACLKYHPGFNPCLDEAARLGVKP